MACYKQSFKSNSLVLTVLVLVVNIVSIHFCLAQTSGESIPTRDLTAKVEVAGFAQLIIDQDELSLGRAQPGESTEWVSLGITCMTNLNERWSLTMHVNNPLLLLPEGDSTIPNSDFNWQLIDSEGRLLLDGTMPSTPRVIYTAGMEEYITEVPVQLALLFSIDIPQGQVKGTYETTIIVTMQPEAI